jgi:hypothetical protein
MILVTASDSQIHFISLDVSVLRFNSFKKPKTKWRSIMPHFSLRYNKRRSVTMFSLQMLVRGRNTALFGARHLSSVYE